MTTQTTSERIFGAAEQLLATEGIERFTIPRVAAGAGLARATVYNHFGSRDELVLRLLQRAMDLRTPITHPAAGTEERVAAVALSMISAFAQTIGSPAASMAAMTAPDPALHELQASIAAEMTARFKAALGVEHAELVAVALVWVTTALLLRAGYGEVEVEDLEARIASITNVVLGGVAGKEHVCQPR